MSPSEPGYSGTRGVWAENNDLNAINLLVRMLIGELATAALVQVRAVHADDGPTGTVDVRPMVAMVDGQGNGTDHVTIYGVPLFRLQGGASAVICDPAVGDIGLAVFCSRDISKVKATQAPALPGSARQYDWSDGVYFGGVLNAAATQYLRMGGGIDLETPVVSASRSLVIGNGATGSFSTTAGQVVNVQNGVIVSIT